MQEHIFDSRWKRFQTGHISNSLGECARLTNGKALKSSIIEEQYVLEEIGRIETMAKIESNIRELSTTVRQRSNQTLEGVSHQIERVTDYLKQHNSQEMLEDVKHIIQKHPGKSLLLSLLLGAMVGKTLSR